MLKLEAAAREVVRNWGKGDLAEAFRDLSQALATLDADRQAHEQSIEAARQRTNNELKIDDLPLLSVGDEGVWVSAWVYVPIEERSKSDMSQWLVLPDEATAMYKNVGDCRPGDASDLVIKVNADPTLNQGHTDWRLPTLDELKALIGTKDAPKCYAYWSSSPHTDYSGGGWAVSFTNGKADGSYRSLKFRVRLVRDRH